MLQAQARHTARSGKAARYSSQIKLYGRRAVAQSGCEQTSAARPISSIALPEMFLVHSLKWRIRTNIDEEGQELPIIGAGVFDISFVVNSL
jgi:hypothetical protein